MIETQHHQVSRCTLDVVCGVIYNEADQILITQRSPHGSHPKDWEFPGGKKRADETLVQALKREIKEEINIDCIAISPYLSIDHRYPDYDIRLHAYTIFSFKGDVTLNEAQTDYRWIETKALSQYRFPKANHAIIEKLMTNG